MIDLNISALVALCLFCVEHMERGGCIINIASQAAFQPLPYQNLYSSTKAFVHNYTRALNVELKEKGIRAIAVCPGWMKTGLYDRAFINARKGTRRFPGMVQPGIVAQKAMRDVQRGRDLSVFGLYAKLGHSAAKLLPQRTVMRLWLLEQHLRP